MAKKKEQPQTPRSDADEIEFWKRRAGRLRIALLDISGGHADPRQRASDAIEAERDARKSVAQPRSKLNARKIEELLREPFCKCKEPLPPTEQYNPWGQANLTKTVCSSCGYRREPTMQHNKGERDAAL